VNEADNDINQSANQLQRDASPVLFDLVAADNVGDQDHQKCATTNHVKWQPI
jgi:hypothetical protein